MSILLLFVIALVAMIVSWGIVLLRHERSRRHEERKAVDEYLGSVPRRLRQPVRLSSADAETRKVPIIRNALDHIHTPTPPYHAPTLKDTPMATYNASELGGPQDNIVDPSSLPPNTPRPAKGDMGLPADMPMAPSSSVNDFHTWREQDQAVAQLASQLAEMDGAPWEVHELELEQAPAPASSQYWIGNYYDTRKSLIMNLANQLNKLSSPLATWLESAAVTVGGPGKVPCVKAGNRTICGATPADAKQLNADVITITAPIRIRILAELNAFGKTGVFPAEAGKRYWTAQVNNQLCLFFSTQAEAQEYATKLNASYQDVAAKPRAAILAELAEVTDPSMGATLKSDPGEVQMPDFRKAANQRVCGA
jgi:hypothetical protein